MNAKLKRIGKVLFFGAASLIAVVSVVSTAWTLSGSNRWELEMDKNGVQVYSFKAPGSFTKQFKGVTRGDYTQSQFVAALLLDNHSLDNCKEWIPTCVGLQVLEPYSEQAQGDSVLWTLEVLPPLFANREYVIKSHAAQDPTTKVVAIDILAAANKVPLNDCCVRVTHIHNRWQITPLDNGQVEVQLVQDFSMGGFFPDFLLNLANTEETYKLFHDQLPALVNKEKYRAARFDFIDEGEKVASAL
jgi:hypothetical protein